MFKAFVLLAVVAVLVVSGCTQNNTPPQPQQDAQIQPPADQQVQQPADVLDQQIDTFPQDNVTDVQDDLTGALLAQ